MEARWPIRDGDRVVRWEKSEGSTAETVRKRLERPWTATRTMEVLRRCPLAIAQQLVHCAIALSTAVLDRVTKTMSVALLLTNNLDNSNQKTSNLLSPAPPPYSWSLLGKCEGPAPPPSSKISRSFDLTWNPEGTCCHTVNLYTPCNKGGMLESQCPSVVCLFVWACSEDSSMKLNCSAICNQTWCSVASSWARVWWDNTEMLPLRSRSSS